MPGKALTNDQDGRTSRNDERVENGRQNGEVGDGNDGFLEGKDGLESPKKFRRVKIVDFGLQTTSMGWKISKYRHRRLPCRASMEPVPVC